MASIVCSSWIFVLILKLSQTSDEFLLVATTKHIQYFNTSDPDVRPTAIPLANLTNAVAIGYDPRENWIYWSDVATHTISRAHITGRDQQVLFTDAYTADGLTLDVLNRMIYWTDTGNDTIERSNLDGSSRQILIAENLEEPRAIALDVANRKMYWTDWGSAAKIERAALDGSDRQALLTSDLVLPNGLVLDLDNRFMYWIDAELDRLEAAKMDGSSRKVLFTAQGIHPFSLVILGNYIYWSDWQRRAVIKYDRFGTSKTADIVLYLMPRFTCLKVVKLKSGKSILFVGGDNRIREIDLDLEYDPGKDVQRISGVRLPLSVDFDVDANMIYWTELQTKSIRRAYRNGIGEHVLVTDKLGYATGLSVSHETNELFWVDHSIRVIEKLHLSTLTRTILINANETLPSDMALDRTNRHIYWTDVKKNTIERATFEGEGRYIILENLVTPNSIVLDVKGRLLYWAEHDTHTIYRANFDGTTRVRVASSVAVGDLALLGDFLFWTEVKNNYTGRINRYSLRDFSVLLNGRERFMGLQVMKDERITFTDVSPLSGPVSGGTNITISGTNFLRVTEIRIGQDFKCDVYKWNSSTVLARTPSVSIISDEMEYPIYVAFAGNKLISTGYTFTYKPNPTVMTEGNIAFTDVSPLTGPVAGGTNITISGANFLRVTEVWIGQDFKCDIYKRNSSTILARTPSVSIISDEMEYLIYVAFAGNKLISTGYTFTYKPNPTVLSLHPITTLKRGGSILTVTGDHLDSVAKPVLNLTRVQRTVEISTNIIIRETTTTRFGDCHVVNRSQVKCITPTFENINNTLITKDGKVRVTRQAMSTHDQQSKSTLGQVPRSKTITGEAHTVMKRNTATKEIDIIYAGLLLDGVVKYRDLSKNPETRSFSEISFIQPPSFIRSTHTTSFEFSPGQKLAMEGERVDTLAVENYVVDIGMGRCDNITLTSNKLFCLPPQKEPPPSAGQKGHKHPVVIHIGKNIAEAVGEIAYPNSEDIYIGVGVSGILLLAAVIIAIVWLCRRRAVQKNAEDNNDTNTEESSHEYMHLAPVGSANYI